MIVVVLMVEGNVCSKIYQRCDDINCDEHCKSVYGKSNIGYICDTYNSCTCFFEQDASSKDTCYVGMGFCFGSCDLACCQAKCAQTLKNGFGDCFPNFGTKDRCICAYNS